VASADVHQVISTKTEDRCLSPSPSNELTIRSMSQRRLAYLQTKEDVIRKKMVVLRLHSESRGDATKDCTFNAAGCMAWRLVQHRALYECHIAGPMPHLSSLCSHKHQVSPKGDPSG
jgi:hypothetical protein